MTVQFPRVFALLCCLGTLAFGAGCAAENGTDQAASSESALRSAPSFELLVDASGDYRFNLIASNQEVLLSSEGYTTRTSALAGVLSVVDNGSVPSRYELRTSKTGDAFYVLKAGNGRVIGTSELYASRQGAESGIAAAVRNVVAYLDDVSSRTGARFDVFAGRDGRFYFNLHAQNGAVMLTSQGYAEEASAWNGAFSVAENAVDATRYEVRASVDGGAYLVLKAANGLVIATSEVYATDSNAERARDSIVEFVPTATLL